jgi:hypothetical protein
LVALSVNSVVLEEHPLQSWPWFAGVLGGLGVIPTIYGCASYAKGKGHRASLGGVLGAVLALSWLMVAASPDHIELGVPSSVALIALALLPDRHRRRASAQPSPGQ